jgi:hypothetical protein
MTLKILVTSITIHDDPDCWIAFGKGQHEESGDVITFWADRKKIAPLGQMINIYGPQYAYLSPCQVLTRTPVMIQGLH